MGSRLLRDLREEAKQVAQVGTVLGLESFWTLLPLAAPGSTVIILRVTFWGSARKAWVPAYSGPSGREGKDLVKFSSAYALTTYSAAASLQTN